MKCHEMLIGVEIVKAGSGAFSFSVRSGVWHRRGMGTRR